MKCSVVVVTLLCSVALSILDARNVPAEPRFEVVSVRPTSASTPTWLSTSNWYPARFTATRITVQTLIAMAYDVPAHLVAGGPGWIGSERFDIVATVPEGATPDDRPLMLRGLAASRFGLVLHEDTRDAEVYTLVMAHEDRRLGPGLTRPVEDVDCERIVAERRANPAAAMRRFREGGPLLRSGPICDSTQWSRPSPGGGHQFAWEAGRQPMAALADLLSRRLERPVIDRTGLTGDFDFRLEYVEPDATTEPGSGPNVFVALEEQLGLRLESSRGPVTFLVIDAVTRPEPN